VRAIAETGITLVQEIVPPAIRGQYTAVVSIFEVAARLPARPRPRT